LPKNALSIGGLLAQRRGMLLCCLSCLAEHWFVNPIPTLPSP
jgi:hypothetical protein